MVGGIPFKVQLERYAGEDAGVVAYDDQLIRLCTGMGPQAELETLFHELVHAMNMQLGIPDDEQTVQGTAGALTALLVHNPSLRKYIEHVANFEDRREQ